VPGQGTIGELLTQDAGLLDDQRFRAATHDTALVTTLS
jgi:hypothetical protein